MYKLKFWAIALSALLFFSACEDETDDADDHSGEHFEPVKWEIKSENEIIMIIDNGEFDSNYSDHFHLEEGVQSPNYNIIFYDKDGGIIEPGRDEYSFGWRFEDLDDNTQSEVAEIINTDGNFSFSINPLKEGEIDIQLLVYHGNHADVKTPEIEVEVE